MKNTNKYGFISGGYIFDLLDRAALAEINAQYPETANQQIYTAWSEIDFFKQLCDTNDIIIKTNMINKSESNPSLWIIENTLYQGEEAIACATFRFLRANKNFCEIKN